MAPARALQMHRFSVTRALVLFLQSVTPLGSFLLVSHASHSVFIKGISSLVIHVLFNLFCVCVLSVKLSIPPTLGKCNIGVVSLTEENQSSTDNRNEVKEVSETVYKNGTFIATERSCT